MQVVFEDWTSDKKLRQTVSWAIRDGKKRMKCDCLRVGVNGKTRSIGQ